MLQKVSMRRLMSVLLTTALMCAMAVPAYALFGKKEYTTPTLSNLVRNVVLGECFTFRAEDFVVSGNDRLAAVTITTVPDQSCGVLMVGEQPIGAGTIVQTQALSALSFYPSTATTASKATFMVTPTFSSGTQGTPASVDIHLLTAPNQSPIAENFSLKTYKNVAITGQLKATDPEGDAITFQLTNSPARGSVALMEDGSGRFTYTPYENKSGKDSFMYVAVDRAGNISNPAKVTLRIDKAKTAVTYSDMAGNPAHHAAMQLAEQGILVGEQINGLYFFAPDTPVSRGQFLTLAMAAAGLDPLKQVSLTGFFDDQAIPTWSKGYVSSALMAGAVTGMRNEQGQAVFCPDRTITRGEAAAMLDKLLNVSEVAVQTWSMAGINHNTQDHWAMQSAADLACAGVLQLENSTPETLDSPLTRADAALLLSESFDLIANRKSGLFG